MNLYRVWVPESFERFCFFGTMFSFGEAGGGGAEGGSGGARWAGGGELGGRGFGGESSRGCK